jgi:hypothetical protein
VSGPTSQGRQTVGLALMKSEEGDATVAYLADAFPLHRIQDRGTFYLVEAEGSIRVDLRAVGEYVGRELPMHEFLVTMTSYYGRAQVEDDGFLVSADMLQFEAGSGAPLGDAR